MAKRRRLWHSTESLIKENSSPTIQIDKVQRTLMNFRRHRYTRQNRYVQKTIDIEERERKKKRNRRERPRSHIVHYDFPCDDIVKIALLFVQRVYCSLVSGLILHWKSICMRFNVSL